MAKNELSDHEVLQIFHEDKEIGVAKAGANVDVTYTMSSAAASSIEEAAEASGDGLRFFQLWVVDRAG